MQPQIKPPGITVCCIVTRQQQDRALLMNSTPSSRSVGRVKMLLLILMSYNVITWVQYHYNPWLQFVLNCAQFRMLQVQVVRRRQFSLSNQRMNSGLRSKVYLCIVLNLYWIERGFDPLTAVHKYFKEKFNCIRITLSREKLWSVEETDVNQVSVRSTAILCPWINPMPTGQRHGSKDLFPFVYRMILSLRVEVKIHSPFVYRMIWSLRVDW